VIAATSLQSKNRRLFVQALGQFTQNRNRPRELLAFMLSHKAVARQLEGFVIGAFAGYLLVEHSQFQKWLFP